MTKDNKLTRPLAGVWYQQPIYVGSVPTGFTWNVNPENKEFEVVKVMPEGQEDVVVFSSRDKSQAEASLRTVIEKAYPGLLAQNGFTYSSV
jgi:hypothetical protein